MPPRGGSIAVRSAAAARSIWCSILLQRPRCARRRRVIHRDLKPDNVFVLDSGAERHAHQLSTGLRVSRDDPLHGMIARHAELRRAPEQVISGEIHAGHRHPTRSAS